MQSLAGKFSSLRSATLASVALLLCFVFWNLGLMFQWGTHLIPARGPVSFAEAAHNQFVVVPRQLTGLLHDYFFRRKEFMRQIEQRDVEQLKEHPVP